MLNSFIFSFKFLRFIQTGLYFDFILKNFIEIFVRNIFIYSFYFFGEKYMIEFLTKKIIDAYIFNLNRYIGFFEFFYSYFFIQIISCIFLCFFIFNLLLFLFI